jgi:hypothetical protein
VTSIFLTQRPSLGYKNLEEQIQLSILQPESVPVNEDQISMEMESSTSNVTICEDLQKVEHQPFQLMVLFDTPRMNIMKVDTDRKIELGARSS